MLRPDQLLKALLLVSVLGQCPGHAQQLPTDQAGKDRMTEAGKRQAMAIWAQKGVNLTMKVPVNFPVPLYSANVISTGFSNTTKGSPSANLGIITRDQPATVFSWYQTELRNKGWQLKEASPKLIAKMGKTGELFMLEGNKDINGIKLFCILDKATRGTRIQITWFKNAK
jgi:hypothetical protein